MKMVMRALTLPMAGTSCAVLYAVMLILLAIEWVLSTLMSISDGIFAFVEYHLQDQMHTFMRALHGDEWQPAVDEEGEEDGE